jgi:hypothetical protein
MFATNGLVSRSHQPSPRLAWVTKGAIWSGKCKGIKMNSVIVFEVSQEEEGGFVAECLTEDIFTQGDIMSMKRLRDIISISLVVLK